MAITFQCEHCGKSFDVDDSFAGRRGKCKQCGHVSVIPGARPAVKSAPVAQGRPRAEGPPPSRPKPAGARPASAAAKPAAPEPSAFDPYGLDEEGPLPSRAATVPAEQDEEFLPPRPGGPVATKKKKKKSGGGFSADNVPGWIYLAGLAVIGLAVAWAMMSRAGAAIVLAGGMFLGIGMVLIGSIGCLVVAFRESIVCGLLYLFLPFYGLYYLVTRWSDVKTFFLLSFGGGMIMGVMNALLIGIVGHPPGGNPPPFQAPGMRNEGPFAPPGMPDRQPFAPPGMPNQPPFQGPQGGRPF